MAIFRIYVRDKNFKSEAIRTETVYLLEGPTSLNPNAFVSAFFNGKHQMWSYVSAFPEQDGPIFEIRYKRSVVDPEVNSMFAVAHSIGEHSLEWGRVGKRYQFAGMSEQDARAYIDQNLFNPTVQEITNPDVKLATLKPVGTPDPVQLVSLKNMSDKELLALSAKHSWNAPLAQLKAVQEHGNTRNRPFTDAELELIFGSWSDHCYHTTWKGLGLLQALKDATRRINHPLVVSAFDDNAGGIDFDGETVIILKGETHNHPFAIEPRGAIETKHGGVLRDVIGFGKGGYPIGGTTIIATATKEANPKECLDPNRLTREAIQATASYCNPMGVPILHAAYKEHPKYAKPLALGHAFGVIPKKYALKDDPRPGDVALLIGGRTGRDGIHGATASSGEITTESHAKDFATVQIGDPITERRIMETIPHIRNENCIRSLTDLGAMGIAGAIGEMGAKTGARVNLNLVPLKDTGLTAWEILVSESQERMLLVIPPEKLTQTKEILDLYGVEYAAIGTFTDTKKFEAFWKNPVSRSARRNPECRTSSVLHKVIDIDMKFLWSACPIETPEITKPQYVGLTMSYIKHDLVSLHGFKKRALETLGGYNVSSKEAALAQFDKTVQGRTIIGPLGGKNGKMPTHISVLAPTRAKRGSITAISFNPQWAYLDPQAYVERNFLEAVSRAVLGGADPKTIVICSNFYTQKPTSENNWHLKKMVEALATITEEFKMPVVTGKDSSSGTYTDKNGDRRDVPPTFVPLALGIVPDVKNIVTQDFKEVGSKLVLVGPLPRNVHLAGQAPNKKNSGIITRWKTHHPGRRFYERIQALYQKDNTPILAASVIGEGGLIRNLFEMSYGGAMGVALESSSFGNKKIESILFEDFIGCFLFEISTDAKPENIFRGISWRSIGHTQKEPSIFARYDRNKHWLRWKIAELANVYEKTFTAAVAHAGSGVPKENLA